MGAYVSDAAPYGGALPETKTKLRELPREALSAEMKGRPVRLGAPKSGAAKFKLGTVAGRGGVGYKVHAEDSLHSMHNGRSYILLYIIPIDVLTSELTLIIQF